MADFVIETEKTVISDDIGVWYYSSLLLQDNDYENTGLNQAHLLAWLKKENKGKIIDDYIKKGLIIKKPKGKTDIIKICGFTIITNKELEFDFEEDYCVKFSDLMIFKSIKQPGFDKNNNPMPDMLSNDEDDQKILTYGEEFKTTISEYNKIMTVDIYRFNPSAFLNYRIDEPILIGEMRNLLLTCSIFSSTMKAENESLLNHFINGNGKDFTSKELTNAVRKNNSTKQYVELTLSIIEKCIKLYNGDLYQLVSDDFIAKDIQKNAVFPSFNNPFTGLMIAIHFTHGNNIKIKNAKIENDLFSCKVEFDIFDHYGLNREDLNNSAMGIKFVNLAGFRAWYYLQHSKKYAGKYKPFITHAKFEEELRFTI